MDGDPTETIRVVDWGPHAWFLFQEGEDLYLDARYSYSGLIDDSALIRLSVAERTAYSEQGHVYLDLLQQEIHNSAPYIEGTPYASRNLYRQDGGASRREAAHAAFSAWRAGHS